ncbi:hypothetical protein LCGC14_1347750 [marine sediment metagenome]|uniref:Uncharacterized protein n=1 Tax=marine sediment metagenome TaxID=412755 RepID=A0A0F9KXU6_9ZZZZ
MKTVFLARCGYEYFTYSYSHGPIDKAMMWASREAAECYLKPLNATYGIIEFKLVEIKPTVKITLTSRGTDVVWTKVFPNFDLKKPLYRDTLSNLLLQDIKETQDRGRPRHSGELVKLRTILHCVYPMISKSFDIVLGGVLLGHIEYEVIK